LIDVNSLPRTLRAAIDAHQGGASCTPYDPIVAVKPSTITGLTMGKDLGGTIGGGVITCSAGGAQKVAVAIGFTNILWPTKVAIGKINKRPDPEIARCGPEPSE
jgi:hypothetical protein